jgi:hypothetical protein
MLRSCRGFAVLAMDYVKKVDMRIPNGGARDSHKDD